MTGMSVAVMPRWRSACQRGSSAAQTSSGIDDRDQVAEDGADDAEEVGVDGICVDIGPVVRVGVGAACSEPGAAVCDGVAFGDAARLGHERRVYAGGDQGFHRSSGLLLRLHPPWYTLCRVPARLAREKRGDNPSIACQLGSCGNCPDPEECICPCHEEEGE